MRREAWLQRQTRPADQPDPAAQTAAVVSAVPVPEGETTAAAAFLASEGKAAAAASGQHLAQCGNACSSWNSLCGSSISSINTTKILGMGAKKRACYGGKEGPGSLYEVSRDTTRTGSYWRPQCQSMQHDGGVDGGGGA
jgi:hypothetical protein